MSDSNSNFRSVVVSAKANSLSCAEINGYVGFPFVGPTWVGDKRFQWGSQVLARYKRVR